MYGYEVCTYIPTSWGVTSPCCKHKKRNSRNRELKLGMLRLARKKKSAGKVKATTLSLYFVGDLSSCSLPSLMASYIY